MSALAFHGDDRRSISRRGWCPGALRPMASGDGLIARLRIVGGALTPKAARAIAEAAAAFGNGHIDLTSRANLQIRGVSERTLPSLQAALRGLVLTDADSQAEAVRNIVASPLAGLDPAALLDIRPAVAELDQRLRRDDALWRLPGKFGFLIDDGGRFSVARERADIGFLAERRGDEIGFALRLAGRPAGFCAAAELADRAARLASAFLALRGAGERAAGRMSALIAQSGVAPILRAAGLECEPRYERAGVLRDDGPERILGAHDLAGFCAFGAGAPFGRLDAAMLALLADIAESLQGELRLTPWRAILIVGAEEAPAERLRNAGFVTADDDPIRAVAACPGAPACASAATATQRDAALLAPLARRLAPRGVALHVSGCAKGCAHAATAPATLIGRGGRYDLVLDGCAGDEPLLRGVPAEQLGALLASLADTPQADRPAALRALLGTET